MKKIFLVLSIFAIGLTLTACKDDTTVDTGYTAEEIAALEAEITALEAEVADLEALLAVEPCDATISVDGVWANVKLRNALSYSINREEITETLGAGQVPAGGMVPPGFLDHNDLDFFMVAGNYGLETDDTNYAEAVTLFAQAAEEMGLTVAELQAAIEQEELLFNTSEGHQLVAQMVQQMWADNLGFTIPLANEEWAVFQDTRSEGNFSIARGGWLTDFMDPSGLLSIFASSNAYNDPNYYNDAFDDLLAAAQATTDPQVHFDTLYEAQEMFMLDMPMIPVYHYTDTMLASDNLIDWGRSVLGTIDFSRASLAVGTEMNWNIGADPATLDPGLNGASDGGDVINQTFEGLVREINGEVLPGVAESWETSADGLTVTFTLRDSQWSDDSDVTAADFVYSWLRGMNPETASEYAWIWEYTNIVGAQAFAEGEGTAAAVGIRALDASTLEVDLVNPTSYFVSLMAFYHFMPVKQSAVEAVGGEEGTWAKDPELLVSNGPFTLTAYSVGAGLTLVKNVNYWNAEVVGIDTITGAFNDDAVSAYATYQTGDFDFIPGVPTAEVPTLIAESDEFYVYPLLGTYYYSFNLDQDGDGANEQGTVCP
jgi:ABC-type oligopeptide transport system substrate-binding subunit